MATAAKDKPEQLTDGQVFDFYSRHRALRLVRIPEQVVPTGYGGHQAVERFPGVRRRVYEFEKGHLQVVVGGKNWDVWPDGPGDAEQNTLDFLRSHEDMNIKFHLAGEEPGRPQPTDEVFMDQVTQATLDLDLERLVEMLRTERDTHQRPNLITIADNARKRVLAARQQIEAASVSDPE